MDDAEPLRWLFTSESMRKTPYVSERSLPDSKAWEEEMAKRRNAIRHIMTVGKGLKMSVVTTAIATVYLHRFYQGQSIKQFDGVAMARCCLMLAAKCEDRARDGKKRHRPNLDELIAFSYWLWCTAPDHIAPLTISRPILPWHSRKHPQLERGSPQQARQAVPEPLRTRLKDQLLENERVLLPTLGFDFAVEVPHQFIALAVGQADVHARAWKVANNLMASTMPLLYPARLLACGLLNEAASHKKVKLRNLEDGRPWFHAFQTPICTFGQAEVDAVTAAVREWTRLPYGRRDNADVGPPAAAATIPPPSGRDSHKRSRTEDMEGHQLLKPRPR